MLLLFLYVFSSFSFDLTFLANVVLDSCLKDETNRTQNFNHNIPVIIVWSLNYPIQIKAFLLNNNEQIFTQKDNLPSREQLKSSRY